MEFIFVFFIIILGMFILGIIVSGLKAFCGLKDEQNAPINKGKENPQVTPINLMVGAISVATDKRGTFINYAEQFLKPAPTSYAKLKPYLPQLVDRIFEYGLERKYELADEVDLIEGALYMFVKRFAEVEIDNLQVNGSASITEGFRVYSAFLEEYSIK